MYGQQAALAGFDAINAIASGAIVVVLAAVAAYAVYRGFVVPLVFPKLCIGGYGVCATLSYQSQDNAALVHVMEQSMTVFFNGQRAFMYPIPSRTNVPVCGKDRVLAYAVNRVTGELMFHQCAPKLEQVEALFVDSPRHEIVHPLERRGGGVGYLTAGEAVRVLEEHGVINRYDPTLAQQ